MPNMAEAKRGAGTASSVLGQIELDQPELDAQLEALPPDCFINPYPGFAVGPWRSCSLWNRSGRSQDAGIEEYDGAAVATDLGRLTPAITRMLRANFELTVLKSARLFCVEEDGLILPHRDYLEFDRGFTRLHVPLITNSAALNIEDDQAIHMRPGEVWFLDARRTHCAAVVGKARRVHLVLDFEPTSDPSSLLKAASSAETPYVARRAAFDRRLLEALQNDFCRPASHSEWVNAIHTLARFCVRHEVDCGAMYEWLKEIARQSGNAELLADADLMQRYFVTEGVLCDEPIVVRWHREQAGSGVPE